jgi:hypothetical protein
LWQGWIHCETVIVRDRDISVAPEPISGLPMTGDLRRRRFSDRPRVWPLDAIGDERFDCEEIHRLYEGGGYPLRRITAPT